MAIWNEILTEVQNTGTQYDTVRRNYLVKLSNYTKRNVIAYYSAWLSKRQANNVDINDGDMEGFMTCVHQMDYGKGLDLVLHTPGGDPTAAESIVNYLRDKFKNNIRVIVPHLAMSAGTMIACAGKEIIMGKQSSLGPIDPQFNGIPAYNIKLEFEEAKEDLSNNPQNVHYWAIKLQQYPAAFMQSAIDAIDLSETLIREWLGSCMFDNTKESDINTIDAIVSKFNDHKISKTHSRHFNADFCKKAGLKIHMMEDDQTLQDDILSMHHAYMISLNSTNAIKIIKSQNNKSQISLTL